MSNDKLGRALGITDDAPIIEAKPRKTTTTEVEVVETPPHAEVPVELEKAKKNLETIVTQGLSAYTELVEIAKTSENSKDFSALASVMKSLLDANREMVDMAMRKKVIEEAEKMAANPQQEQPVTTNITHNNTVVMTTAQFAEMMALKAGEPTEGDDA